MTRLRFPNRFELGLLVLVAAGALVIGLGIGSHPFWFDELLSVSVADRSLGGTLDAAGDLSNMGLYYLLLHAWMWGGDSEVWVRWLSALPAVAAIPVTAILARRLFGDAVGLVAGFLMVGSMFVVQNAQHARAYALALLLITVATLLFVEVICSRRSGLFLAYGAVSALAVYASPLSGLVLVAHLASLPFLPQARSLARPFALTYGAVLLALAPLATVMFVHPDAEPVYLERPGLSDLRAVAWDMLGAATNRPLRLAYGALVMTGLVALWRGWMSGERRAEAWRWRRSLVIGWLLLPPALLFVYSQAQPLFLSRYLLTSVPALAITAAIGLVALARRSRALAIAATAVMICLAVLARIELEPFGQSWAQTSEAAARMIASQSRAGDGLAYAPPNTRLFDYYLEREAAPGADLPADFAVAAEESGHLAFDAREVSPDIRVRRLRGYPRVWLVGWVDSDSTTAESTEPMLDVLRSEYRRVRLRDFGAKGTIVTRVELYQRERDR